MTASLRSNHRVLSDDPAFSAALDWVAKDEPLRSCSIAYAAFAAGAAWQREQIAERLERFLEEHCRAG